LHFRFSVSQLFRSVPFSSEHEAQQTKHNRTNTANKNTNKNTTHSWQGFFFFLLPLVWNVSLCGQNVGLFRREKTAPTRGTLRSDAAFFFKVKRTAL
jgi:hypothetical protein